MIGYYQIILRQNSCWHTINHHFLPLFSIFFCIQLTRHPFENFLCSNWKLGDRFLEIIWPTMVQLRWFPLLPLLDLPRGCDSEMHLSPKSPLEVKEVDNFCFFERKPWGVHLQLGTPKFGFSVTWNSHHFQYSFIDFQDFFISYRESAQNSFIYRLILFCVSPKKRQIILEGQFTIYREEPKSH